MSGRSLMAVAESLMFERDRADDREFIETLRRRGTGLLSASRAKKAYAGDHRQTFGQIGSLLQAAAERIRSLHNELVEVRLHRDSLNDQVRGAMRKYEQLEREMRKEYVDRIADLSVKLESVKRDNATMWTELLRYRNQTINAPTAATGRRFYEDE